jgi:hypothetical protein
MNEVSTDGPGGTKGAVGGILGLVTNPTGRFVLSVAANVLLLFVIVTGGLVRVAAGPIVIEPVNGDVASRIASLFDQKGQALVGVQEGLAGRSFVQISNDNQTAEPVVRALAKLEGEHVLVRKLRELSQRSIHPFDGKPRQVAVRASNETSITLGRAAYCDGDLEDAYLRIWTNDGVGGVQVRATDRIECPPERGNLIEINRDDWLKLAPGDARELHATAKVYPHEPPTARN